jgi:hypothetical protein
VLFVVSFINSLLVVVPFSCVLRSHFLALSNEEKLILKLMLVNLVQNLENEALSNQLHDGVVTDDPTVKLTAKQSRTMRQLKQTIDEMSDDSL